MSTAHKKVKHKRHCINTRHAPQAIGPYNQAVLIDGTLYISGQLGIDPGTMELVEGGVEEEAIQVKRRRHHFEPPSHNSRQQTTKIQ